MVAWLAAVWSTAIACSISGGKESVCCSCRVRWAPKRTAYWCSRCRRCLTCTLGVSAQVRSRAPCHGMRSMVPRDNLPTAGAGGHQGGAWIRPPCAPLLYMYAGHHLMSCAACGVGWWQRGTCPFIGVHCTYAASAPAGTTKADHSHCALIGGVEPQELSVPGGHTGSKHAASWQLGRHRSAPSGGL
jgi:hypothetical protein